MTQERPISLHSAVPSDNIYTRDQKQKTFFSSKLDSLIKWANGSDRGTREGKVDSLSIRTVAGMTRFQAIVHCIYKGLIKPVQVTPVDYNVEFIQALTVREREILQIMQEYRVCYPEDIKPILEKTKQEARSVNTLKIQLASIRSKLHAKTSIQAGVLFIISNLENDTST